VKKKSSEHNTRILKAFIKIYLITIQFAKQYQEKHQQILYFTPVFFLRSFTAFRRLFADRQHNVSETENKYLEGLDKIRSKIDEI